MYSVSRFCEFIINQTYGRLALVAILALPQIAQGSDFSQVAWSLAKQELKEATQALEKRVEACGRQTQPIDLTAFRSTDLNRTEQLMVLRYFYTKHQIECIRFELGQFFIAAQTVQTLKPEHQGARAMIKLFSSDLAKHYQYYVMYIQLPEATREALARIEFLQHPFNFYQIARALGLIAEDTTQPNTP